MNSYAGTTWFGFEVNDVNPQATSFSTLTALLVLDRYVLKTDQDKGHNIILKNLPLYTTADYERFKVMAEIKKAEEGDTAAQVSVGIRYFKGDGVDQNYMDAWKWLQNPAAQGDAAAQSYVAQFYLYGMAGVQKDVSIAVQMLEKAAARQEPEALSLLGEMYWEGNGVAADRQKGFAMLQKAAAAGLPAANVTVGVIYRNGLMGAVDHAKAFQHFSIAAEAGNSNAQNLLGIMYNNGVHVSKDVNKARQWYEKAAEEETGQSLATILNNLAVTYYDNGWEWRDMPKAIELYQKSASLGNSSANLYLGNIYFSSNYGVKDVNKAIDYYRKATEQGNAVACYMLGELYNTGNGVLKNPAQAMQYYQKAAEAGNHKAGVNLAITDCVFGPFNFCITPGRI